MSDEHDTSLPAEANEAWVAFRAMGETKQAYFTFLQELDQKYDSNEAPSIAENLKLEQLLKQHDEKVGAFNEAMAKVTDTSARQALLAKMTSASAAIGSH